jgi:hypothetical protein
MNSWAWAPSTSSLQGQAVASVFAGQPPAPSSPTGQPYYGKLEQEGAMSFNDPSRNPFFRYYPLQKIGASVTTHSNVYAVWITVGNFEVQRIPLSQLGSSPDLAKSNPDGYQLVRELNSDLGAVSRHRAFFIYDRTIPVGFQRGENLNVDKGILTQRIIQ